MFWTFVFILSGFGILAITLAKRIEIKGAGDRKFFFLRILAKGDERARDLYHKSLHFYSEGKHKFLFLIKKQLPTRTKIYLNKGVGYLKEKGEARFGNIRNSRLIKRQEGISEFFKNISEVEKGGGELHDDVYVEETVAVKEEILAYRITPDPTLKTKKSHTPRSSPKVSPVTEITFVPTHHAPKKPRAKKVKVEVIE